MKKILYAGSEIMPFAATGGLGDVMGSLPAAVNAEIPRTISVRSCRFIAGYRKNIGKG